jgi:hypothetical protein
MMCGDSDDVDPFAVRVPDDWEPEQAEAVILFLEAVLDTIHRNYDWSIVQMHDDRRAASHAPGAPRAAPDGDLPF